MKVRLDYLDSIRGVAALLVVLSHVFETFLFNNSSGYPVLGNLYENIELGRLGVIVFFLTSGFVIPWSLKTNTAHTVKNFVIKRFFRLYPAYWLSIIVAVVVAMGPGVHVESIQQVLINFTMIHKFLGSESVIGAYWTLHLELVFYVLCAMLFLTGRLHNSNFLILLTVFFSLCALGAAMSLHFLGIRIPVMMPQGLAVMFFGALLRNYFIDKQPGVGKSLIILAVFYFSCMSIADYFYYADSWVKWFSTHTIAFCVFCLFITKIKLNNKLSVYLGRISYSLYLLHPMVIGLTFYLLGDFSYTGTGFYIVILCVVVASIVCADLSYRYIEKPAVDIGYKLTNKFKTRNVA